MDEPTLYNRALLETEIRSIYEAGVFGKCRDLLAYSWCDITTNEAMATGIVGMITLPAGAHAFDLVADDGLLSDTNRVTVEVLATSQTIDRLVAEIDPISLKRMQRALLTLHLHLADRLIHRGNTIAGVVHLKGFIRKVDHFVEPYDPDLAAQWIAQAEAIIATVTSCWPGHSGLEQLLWVVLASDLPDELRDALEANLLKAIERANQQGERAAASDIVADGQRGRLQPTASLTEGSILMEFSGQKGQPYIVEASEDRVNWLPVGLADETAEGGFEFVDREASRLPCRFYRVVTP